jgi:hypothetical protein
VPTGPVFFDTLAAPPVDGADELVRSEFTINPTWLVPGRNVLAVELHQSLVPRAVIARPG